MRSVSNLLCLSYGYGYLPQSRQYNIALWGDAGCIFCHKDMMDSWMRRMWQTAKVPLPKLAYMPAAGSDHPNERHMVVVVVLAVIYP